MVPHEDLTTGSSSSSKAYQHQGPRPAGQGYFESAQDDQNQQPDHYYHRSLVLEQMRSFQQAPAMPQLAVYNPYDPQHPYVIPPTPSLPVTPTPRTTFTDSQNKILEKRFQTNNLIRQKERRELGEEIGLSEMQIKN